MVKGMEGDNCMKDNLRVRGFDVTKTSSRYSKKFLSEKFVPLYYFIAVVFFWALCAIRDSKWIVNKGVRIKELVSILPIFIIFLMGIYTIVFVVKYIDNRINKKVSTKSFKVILFTLFLFSCTVSMLVYLTSYMTTTGYAPIYKKYIVDGVPFIQVLHEAQPIELRCDRNEYEKIIIDDDLAYGISYKSSHFSPGKGTLIYILPSETIDNR